MLGRGKNEPIPADTHHAKGKGFAAGNVAIYKVPQGRRVEILLIDCETGDVIYKANYRTQLKSDFAAWNDAKRRADDYLDGEGLFLQDDLTTNVQLPSVTSHMRGNRW